MRVTVIEFILGFGIQRIRNI